MKVKVIRRIVVVIVIVHFINVRLGLWAETSTVGATMLSGRELMNVSLSDSVLMRRKMNMGMMKTRTMLIGTVKK